MSQRVTDYFNLHEPFQNAAKAAANSVIAGFLSQGLGQQEPDSLPMMDFKPDMLQKIQYEVYRAIMNEVDPATDRSKTNNVIPGPRFGDVDRSMKQIAITCARLNNTVIAKFPRNLLNGPQEP